VGRGISFGTGARYVLDYKDSSLIPKMGRFSFFFQQPITNTGLDQPRVRYVPGTLFQRTNRPEREAERLAPCSVGFQNTRRYSYTVRDMRFADYTLGRYSAFVVRWLETGPLSIHPMTDE